MTPRPKLVSRRRLMSGFGAAALLAAGGPAVAASRTVLRAGTDRIALGPGREAVATWSLQGAAPVLRLGRGGDLDLRLRNDLAGPLATMVLGLDGAAQAAPLTARPVQPPASDQSWLLPLVRAGTLLADPRLLEPPDAPPGRPLPLVIEDGAGPVDRDEVLLIEEWRIGSGGRALAPGTDAAGNETVFTLNGTITPEIAVRPLERLRLRVINGSPRTVIAVKFEGVEVRVMALDSQPAEPFEARNGALVVAPGGRADLHVDVTAPPGTAVALLLHDGREARPLGRLAVARTAPVRPARLPLAGPLPDNGLPAKLDLRSALRIDVALGGAQGGWIAPAALSTATVPAAFRAKPGRTVVLALTNPADRPAVFRLHGHHFRLLDRLDDGWKPFWLDTLAVEPKQTQRVAFAAEHAGRWLIESVGTDWASPRMVRWYAVE